MEKKSRNKGNRVVKDLSPRNTMDVRGGWAVPPETLVANPVKKDAVTTASILSKIG